MADQDFKINIVTLADLTGIKLTQQGMDAIYAAAAAGNKDAIAALDKLQKAYKDAQSAQQKQDEEFAKGIRSATGYGFLLGGAVAAAINNIANEQNKVTKELDKQFESLVRNVQEWNKLAQVATTPQQLATIGEKAVSEIDKLRAAFNAANTDELSTTQKILDSIVHFFSGPIAAGGGKVK